MLEQTLANLATYERFRELSFGRLHYYEVGDGDAHTVVVHGMGSTSSARMFAPLIDSWAKHLHLYLIDLPGFGGSSRQLAYGPTFEVFTDALREFMDAEQLTRVNVVGYSMGGWVSSLFTYESPHRVNRLVLIDTAGMNPAPRPGIDAVPTEEAIYETTRASVREGSQFPAEAADAMARDMIAVSQLPAGHQALAPLSKQMQTPLIRRHWLLQRRLPFITCPALVIWGDQDRMDPYDAWNDEWATTGGDPQKSSKPWVIPGARYERLAGGHHVIWESPRELSALVVDFLSPEQGF